MVAMEGSLLDRPGRREARSRVARRGDVALPGGEAGLTLVGCDRGFEQSLAPPGTLELVGRRPHAGREAGEIACPERGGLQDGRSLDRKPERVRLQLEEEIVARR